MSSSSSRHRNTTMTGVIPPQPQRQRQQRPPQPPPKVPSQRAPLYKSSSSSSSSQQQQQQQQKQLLLLRPSTTTTTSRCVTLCLLMTFSMMHILYYFPTFPFSSSNTNNNHHHNNNNHHSHNNNNYDYDLNNFYDNYFRTTTTNTKNTNMQIHTHNDNNDTINNNTDHNSTTITITTTTTMSDSSSSSIIDNTTTTTTTTTITLLSLDEAIRAYRSVVQQTNQSRAASQCRERRRLQPPPPYHHPSVNVTPVVSCLQLTHDHPNNNNKNNNKKYRKQHPPLLPLPVALQYPVDAEHHYNEIRYAMAPFAQHAAHTFHTANHYSGPWMENQFIAHFETKYDRDNNDNDNNNDTEDDDTDTDNTSLSCLSDYFGPYIPIFIPWTDHQVHHKFRYPPTMIDTLLSVLRPTVPYLTMNQNARGLKDLNQQLADISQVLPNLVILSAGGYGHVPIPLLKQNEVYEAQSSIPVSDRTMDVSYVGSLTNAPNQVRQTMHTALQHHFTTRRQQSQSPQSLQSPNHHSYNYTYYYGPDWRQVMRQSKLSLVPRGFGRTAYHLMETLQLGLIPIVVYLDHDIEWIPYPDIYHHYPIGGTTNLSSTNTNNSNNNNNVVTTTTNNNGIGYSTTFGNVVPFVEQLLTTLTDEMIANKEEQLIALRDSHYSIEGILQHIQSFLLLHQPLSQPQQLQQLPTTTTTSTTTTTTMMMNDDTTDLKCQALPKYVTGIPKYGS